MSWSDCVYAMALFTCHGIDVPRWYGVDSVRDGYDAHAKLKPGDRIVAVNEQDLFFDSGPSLIERVTSAKGAPLRVTLLRDSAKLDVTLQPQLDNDPRALHDLARLAPSLEPLTRNLLASWPEPVWRIGVKQQIQTYAVSIGVLDAAQRALRYPVEETKQIGGMLYGIVFGSEKADPGGPIRMVEEFKRAFSTSFVRGVQLLMALSVYLGLFNLLPVPALDGGRLVFLGYELVTRRRANPKIEATVHMAGIMALAVVMILVLIVDVRHLF